MYPDIHFSDTFSLPTYLVYLSLLYCFLIFYTYKRALQKRKSLGTALDLALIMMVMGFVGGRLLHVIFESPFTYQEDWKQIFYFWQGGFVFYGGMGSAFICCLAYLFFKDGKKTRSTWLQWADFYAPIIALGYGLGRISCFLAGCCYGTACQLPWAVVFPWDIHGIARHPVQLYMTTWELCLFAFLIWKEQKNKKSGAVFFAWLLGHGLGRVVFEQFRDDFRGDFLSSLSLSTWISLALILLAASGLKLSHHK